jgi:uncharacterized heparinase superfamily protein
MAAMSPAELIWRAGRVVLPGRDSGSPLGDARLSWSGKHWHSALLRAIQPVAAELAAEGERIARGELDLWGHVIQVHPERIDWSHDPLGTDRPSGLLRAGRGDRKPVWELHRHQHLVPLAAAAAVTGRKDWAELCLAQLESWIASNPPRRGPGWTSGYETSHRLVSWAWAVPFISERAPASVLARITDSYLEQAAFVARSPSRFSSANNHRLMELLGLLTGLALTEEQAGWEGLWAELERESSAQTYPDGGSREQASGYFLYVLEILTLAAIVARSGGRPTGTVATTLGSMLSWHEAIADAEGELPPVGDDAEDRPLRLPYFARCDGGLVAARAKAVTSNGSPLVRRKAPGGTPASKALGESGYVVFRTTVDDLPVRVVFDVGELGFGSLAAHGHADALSVLLDVDGRPLLRDSGTGSYAVEGGREEFRGTAAHNTVEVDGTDQAEQRGPHIWGRRYTTKLEAVSLGSPLEYARATHEGYRRLPSSALHTRSVTLLAPGLLVVLDRVQGSRPVRASLLWNLMPGRSAGELMEGRGALAVAATPFAEAGRDEGRFSERYSWQERAPRLRWATKGNEVVFASVVSLESHPEPPLLVLDHGSGVSRVSIAGPRKIELVEDWESECAKVDG